MEEYLIEQWKNKGVSAPTIKLYLFQLRQLNGEPLQNIDFLKDVTKKLERLSKYKTNTIRTKLIAIVAALKCLEHPDLLKEYTEIVKKINDNTDNTTKSETQKENWMNKTEVMDLWKKYDDEVATFANKRKITEKQQETLLRFMILSLYTLISPRRNLDYGRMLIVKKITPEMSDDFNYLDLKTKSFSFRNYKTAGKYNEQIEQIPDTLWNVIKIYLKFHPKDCNWFLCIDGKPLPHSNSITLILNKIFGKKIGCSMLRNIYMSDNFKELQPMLEDLKQKCKELGTSPNTAIHNYIKKN
jgi:hypothetical protein